MPNGKLPSRRPNAMPSSNAMPSAIHTQRTRQRLKYASKNSGAPSSNAIVAAVGVLAAANEVSSKEPQKAFELEKSAATKLKSMGVKIVDNVDKKSFTTIADPYLDKLAKELGPHAEKIKNLIRSIN